MKYIIGNIFMRRCRIFEVTKTKDLKKSFRADIRGLEYNEIIKVNISEVEGGTCKVKYYSEHNEVDSYRVFYTDDLEEATNINVIENVKVDYSHGLRLVERNVNKIENNKAEQRFLSNMIKELKQKELLTESENNALYKQIEVAEKRCKQIEGKYEEATKLYKKRGFFGEMKIDGKD